jgi:glutamine synthetase
MDTPAKQSDPRLHEWHALLQSAPDTQLLELLIADMNGILRGKRVGRREIESVLTRGFNLPGSAVLLDSKGQTIDGVPYGTRDGDPDVYCKVIPGSLAPVPWSARSSAQALVTMTEGTGKPYFADPRTVLRAALAPLKARGLTPVIALELEFYLLENDAAESLTPKVAFIPGTQTRQDGPQCYCLEDLEEVEGFLADVEKACQTQRIPAATALSEYGPGQFEINLHHVPDVELACDHGVLLKRVVKHVARSHGMAACFMAKPFSDCAGSGLHIHISLVDQNGRNVFGTAEGGLSDTLRNAIGGLVETMPEGMAIFAPNANSYRRLRKGVYVPLTPNWGRNHRQMSLRIPLSGPEDARIEHRVAGADANPYLVVASVLAGIEHGIATKSTPPAMIEAGSIVPEVVTLPTRWELALQNLERAQVLPRYLGEHYCDTFVRCRRTEAERYHNEISNRDYEWYLRAV